MRNIKSKKANLENRRTIFLEAGMILALAAVLLAFEWKSMDSGGFGLDMTRNITLEEDMAEITIQKKQEPPKPKVPIAQVFEVVLNDEVFEDEILEIDAENDADDFNNLDNIIEEDEREEEEVQPFRIVQQMPSYPGGDEAYFRFLKANLDYPQMAREAGISGVVYVQFVVSKDGSVGEATVQRGIGGGCDEEALRVVNRMPKWNPGKQLTKPVPVIMILPVHFKLLN